MAKRNEKGQFIPGSSGNPNGRTAKNKSLAEKLTYFGERLAETYSKIAGFPVTVDEAIFIRIQLELVDPNIPINPKLLSVYLDRRYGKVTQSLEINKVSVEIDDSEIQKEYLEYRKRKLLGLESNRTSSIGLGTDSETSDSDEMADNGFRESSEE